MKLQLGREWHTDKSTIGELFVDGQRECFTLEDVVREGPKVPGKTAIPYGAYKITINRSNRFQRDMPLLLDVPGFEGIRIHNGNTAEQTDGCILVGQTREKDFIGASRKAFDLLFSRIQTAIKAGIEVKIIITDERLS